MKAEKLLTINSQLNKMGNKYLKSIQAELKVSRKEYITPHYILLYLTGVKVPLFGNTTIGVNNEILVPSICVKKKAGSKRNYMRIGIGKRAYQKTNLPMTSIGKKKKIK